MAKDILGRDIATNGTSDLVAQLQEAIKTISIGPAKDYKTPEEKEIRQTSKENKSLLKQLAIDLKRIIGDGFSENQKEAEKYIRDMTQDIMKLTNAINTGDIKNLKRKQRELKKEEKKLASYQLMHAFQKDNNKRQDKQISILNKILNCCRTGSSLREAGSTARPKTKRTSAATETGYDTDVSDITGGRTFKDYLTSGSKFNLEEFFGQGSLKSPNEVLFGNKNALKGAMIQLQDISRSLLLIKSHESILGKLTEGIVETQISYEKSVRETLYMTAGVTKENTELFRTMAKLGNTVEITGFKQEETQKAINKLARMGIKYDGDAEKYKKKILNLTTTTLNTEQQLGLEAGALQESFGDLYRFGVLNENSIANLGRGMREVSRTTGLSGESFKKVLGVTQEIMDTMRRAATFTAASAKNFTELGANAEKFGVSQEFGAINKALASTVNLFNEASDGTRLLLFNAAASVGKLGELQAGTLGRSKEGIKALTEGVNNVIKRFGIESADAIDQLSDSAKMRLNLVLKSSFDLELGQIKGVLKTLEASGKTFADKIVDLDKQLAKNISMEKRTAILEEQRKLKIDKNLDLLGILSEAAETSKTMTDAFNKFGTRRKEFESDLKALGLGGSNKDVIRQAIEQSLTGVNAALSKAGLKEISISATEMAKALEDPQSYQDLLSNLTKAEQKAAANAKNTLSGVDATNFKLDQLNAIVQDKIAGPLSSFLNQGVTGIIAANAAILMMPFLLNKVAAMPAMTGFLSKTAPKAAPAVAPAAAVAPAVAPAAPAAGAAALSSQTGYLASGMKFAGSWAKIAVNIAMTAGLLVAGFYILKKIPTFSESEIEEIVNKLKVIGIGLGAAAVMMGEMYLASLALKGIETLKINWLSFTIGGVALLAAAAVMPLFMKGLIAISNATIFEGDVDEVIKKTQDVALIMTAGAAIIAALAASVLIIGGIGYAATSVITNPLAAVGALAVLGTGAALIYAAAAVLPPFIGSVAALASASIDAFGISPTKIQKSLDSLLAIMEPFSKLLGYIVTIGAALTGMAVGGLVGGAVGASAYIIGGLVGSISYFLGGEYKNYGDVKDIISETLRHYFSLISATNNAINDHMGNLTASKINASLGKLQTFNESNKLMVTTLKEFASSTASSIPAYISIVGLSKSLSGLSTTPDEVANKFRDIINVMKGISQIGIELEQGQVMASISQTNSLKEMLTILSNNAIPLFDALAKIEQVTSSKGFKTVSNAEATFAKASKILKSITPNMGDILRSIHDISTKVYEQLKDLNLQTIKDGSDAATGIIKLFNEFIDSSKVIGKDLSPSKIKDFNATFGNKLMVDSLKIVMENTSELANIFNAQGISELNLASISSRTKYYSEFYRSVSDVMSSFAKMTIALSTPSVSNAKRSFDRMTKEGGYSDFWLGMARLQDMIGGIDSYKEARRVEDPELIKASIIKSLSVLKMMAEVSQDPAVLPSMDSLNTARINLKRIIPAIKSISEFSNVFDVNLITTIGAFFTKLEQMPDVPKRYAGLKGFTKISAPFEGMIMTLENMSEKSKDFLTRGVGDFVKLSEALSDLKEPLANINYVFEEMGKIGNAQKSPDFWQNFINSLPNTDSTELNRRMVFLKSYIDEIQKVVEPNFLNAIMSLGKIQGLNLDAKTSSAIELLSNLNNFMNSLKTELSKTPQTTDAKNKNIASFDMKGMTKFLTENVIPILTSVKNIAEQLNNLPLNKTQLEQANAKINLLGQMAGSITDFSKNFYIAADFLNKSVEKVRMENNKLMGYWNTTKITAAEQQEFIDNFKKGLTDKKNAIDNVILSKSEAIKNIFKSPTGLSPKMAGEVSKLEKEISEHKKNVAEIDSQLNLAATSPESIQGFIKDKKWVRQYETQADKMKALFDNENTEESFKTIGKLPKFFQDNILKPFIEGGGSKLRLGNIQFIATALSGINDILKLLSGDENSLLETINVHLQNVVEKGSGNTSSILEKASGIIKEIGKDNAFASFLNSLLANIIIPINFAARIVGGPRTLKYSADSFAAIREAVKTLPDFLTSINTGLRGLGTSKDASLYMKKAMDNIEKIKNDLPKFLESLSLNVILPSFANLPPIAFIAQASKRLKLATELVNVLEPFIQRYAALNASLGGTLDKISLVDSLGNLMKKLDPIDMALSGLVDKLNSVKTSLQEIADSMTTITSINDKSGIVNVLSSIGDIPINEMTAKGNAAINLSAAEGIRSILQAKNVPNKQTQSEKEIETVAENTQKSVTKQQTMINVLNLIYNALVSAGVSNEGSPSGTTMSDIGTFNLNSGNEVGKGGGNIFNSSAYGNNMNLPPGYA